MTYQLVDDDSRARLAAHLPEPYGGLQAFKDRRGWIDLPESHPAYIETARRMWEGEPLGWLPLGLLNECRRKDKL